MPVVSPTMIVLWVIIATHILTTFVPMVPLGNIAQRITNAHQIIVEQIICATEWVMPVLRETVSIIV